MPSFLDIAARRLAAHADRVELIEADATVADMPREIDLYVKSFILHHTDDITKRRIYSRMRAGLLPGGVLINADFVHSASTYYARIFDEIRIEKMQAAGASREEIRVHYVEHRDLERSTPLETQLAWLRDLGLGDIECFWKYLNLAVFGGRMVSRL